MFLNFFLNRESKLLEFSLVQENTSYLQTLKNASNYMENVSENMQSVRDELRDRIESVYEERSMQLTIKEKNLEGKTFLLLFSIMDGVGQVVLN